MAFGCFKPSKEKEEAAAPNDEYAVPVDPTTSTSADLASLTQRSEINGTHRKRFWLFGGKKGKKIAALRADLNQQTEIIIGLKDTLKTEKKAYEDQINHLQSALEATGNKLKTEEDKINGLKDAMKTEKEAYEDQINHLQSTLEATGNKLKTEEEKNSLLIEAHQAKNVNLEAEISERDQIIAKLKETLENAHTSNCQMKKSHDLEKFEHDSEIGELKVLHAREKEELEAVINGLQRINEEKRQSFDRRANRELITENQRFLITKLEESSAKLIDPSRLFIAQTLHRHLHFGGDISFYRFVHRVLLTKSLVYYDNHWLADDIEIPFDDSDFEIFVQHKLEILCQNPSNLSNLIQRLRESSFTFLKLKNFTMSLKDYKNLVSKSNIYHLDIVQVTVRNEDGTLIGVDQLLKLVPNVQKFEYRFNDGETNFETAQRFCELSSFPNLRSLQLWNIQEGFDFKVFGGFIKANPTITFCSLRFNVSKEIFARIKNAKEELVSNLPSTCYFFIQN